MVSDWDWDWGCSCSCIWILHIQTIWQVYSLCWSVVYTKQLAFFSWNDRITFGRAKTLAQQFKIHDLLYPLFVEDPGVFLHNYTAPMQTNRIPSMNGVGAHTQWRPHTFTNAFNGPAYDRQWYGYSNGGGIINQAASQQQDHNSPAYPPNAKYVSKNDFVQRVTITILSYSSIFSSSLATMQPSTLTMNTLIMQ